MKKKQQTPERAAEIATADIHECWEVVGRVTRRDLSGVDGDLLWNFRKQLDACVERVHRAWVKHQDNVRAQAQGGA